MPMLPRQKLPELEHVAYTGSKKWIDVELFTIVGFEELLHRISSR
jgi:hypothetical protein